MNKPMHQPPRMMQNVFVLLLLAVFAVLSTLLVLMGAQVYRSTVARAAATNDKRIISAVVRSAVWAQDGGEVRIRSYDGVDVLEIVDQFEEETYIQRLFCNDGKLWESYTSAEREFDIESGDTLCDLEGFKPSLVGHMLTIRLTMPGGEESELEIYLRAGGADA